MKNSLNFLTLEEFMSEPIIENNWVVDQLLIEGGVSLLVGSPKDGKSTFARHIMKAISVGGTVLGFQAKRGSVMYLALEEVPNQLKKIFYEIQYPVDSDLRILSGPLAWKDKILLEKSIEEFAPSLVVIDTLGRFMSLPDFNDYAIVNQEFSYLLGIARKYGCHIMCLHHANKGDGIGGSRILGSNAFFGLVDNAVFIDREDSFGRISTKPRYGVPIDGRYFKYIDGELVDAGDAKEKLLQNGSSKLIETLERASEALTELELIKRAQMQKQSFKVVLKDMIQLGRIKRSGTGRKGDPYIYSLK